MSNLKNSIPEKLRELLEEFRDIEDRDLKSELLIEYAERFSEVPAEIAQRPFDERNRVPACESDAFVFVVNKATVGSNKTSPHFFFAVENPQGISAKALAVILDETLSGSSRDQISAIHEELVFDIFGKELSMGKGLGLKSMVRLIRDLGTQVEN
jgi:cysteine desulfuration protein SufE